MSKIEVNTVAPQCGTTLTLGESGDTVTLGSGASQSGFGRTGTVDWQTSIKTAGFTAANGEGYFLNTTSGGFTVNLPAGSAGDIVAFKDYANTWDTGNVTITPNGSDKIGGVASNSVLDTESQSVTLIFTDSTRGWIDVHDSTSSVEGAQFIAATGGTITTVCTNFKVHTFTGPGTFEVTTAGNASGSNTVSYMVVAGGGSGGATHGGGGGAGGFREGKASTCSFTASPLASTSGLPVSAQSYPIVVGGGGAAPANPVAPPFSGSSGSDSSFSTITSTAGGRGGGGGAPTGFGADGGSGGGGGNSGPSAGGSGNTPVVTPPQGQDGGNGNGSGGTGGGGGATAAGVPAPGSTNTGGNGGAGATSSINATPTARAGGGGGGASAGSKGCGGAGGGGDGRVSNGGIACAGSTNTGGGGGGGSSSGAGAAGGSGIVIIRYKFQ